MGSLIMCLHLEPLSALLDARIRFDIEMKNIGYEPHYLDSALHVAIVLITH